MGRICPILNHPLKDGVLIEDEALVNFIQKRNVEFLAHELVCRSCKREVTKLYNKKLKKAIELHRSRYQDGSVSSLKTSKHSISSRASTTSEHPPTLNESQRKLANIEKTKNDRDNISGTSFVEKNIGKMSTNMQIVQSMDIVSRATTVDIAENQQHITTAAKTFPAEVENAFATNNLKNVTIRRKQTIKDFLSPIPSKTTVASDAVRNKRTLHISYDPEFDNDNNNDVVRRLSQEPTTSKTAAKNSTNKRPISTIIDSDDDEPSLSMNAVNGTRLPHIQPVPPKRKSEPDNPNPLARDIMDEYIKDITGG